MYLHKAQSRAGICSFWTCRLCIFSSKLGWAARKVNLKQMTQTQMTKFFCQGYGQLPSAGSRLPPLSGTKVSSWRFKMWKYACTYIMSREKCVSEISRQTSVCDWFQHQESASSPKISHCWVVTDRISGVLYEQVHAPGLYFPLWGFKETGFFFTQLIAYYKKESREIQCLWDLYFFTKYKWNWAQKIVRTDIYLKKDNHICKQNCVKVCFCLFSFFPRKWHRKICPGEASMDWICSSFLSSVTEESSRIAQLV